MLRYFIITISFLFLGNSAFSDIPDSDTPEYGGYWQCMTEPLPDLLYQPNVRRLTIGALDCFDVDKIETVKGIVASEQNQQNAVCRVYADLTTACRDYLAQCENDYVGCKAALENVANCMPYLIEASLLFNKVEINTSARLASGLLAFRQKARFCDEEIEYLEKKPALWWDMACNDYNIGPISFYELNESYYEVEEAGQRAELLRRYAMAEPVSESWKRLIVTMMGLESLDSDDASERAAAAKVLGPHGDFSTPIMYKLLTALDDSEPAVRANAALSLRVQGNRKSLVVISLLSKLLDTAELPEVRGNVALALREQATSYPCKPNEEKRYHLEGSENPNDLISGVPICVPYDQKAHEKAEQEEDWWGESQNGADDNGCGSSKRPFANLFDRHTSIAQLKDFNIVDNLCYVGIKMRQSKITPIIKDALLMALQAEDDPVARAKMVAAMRTIGKPVKGDDTILQLLRLQYLNDDDYRVRRAAVFALAQAAKDEDWLLTEVIPKALEDESASVRKAAIAAASELIELSMSKKDTVYQAYVNGMTFHNSRATDCQSSDKTNPKSSTPEGPIESQFFTEGYKAAFLFYQDNCVDASEGRPILAFSNPAMGAQGISKRTDIKLHFSTPVAKEMIIDKIQLFGPRQTRIAYTIKEYKFNAKKRFTSIVLQIADPLAPDQYYQLKFMEGFKSQDAPTEAGGYWQARSLLFKTVSSKVSKTIAEMMTEDTDVDVQYTAAEAFIARNEEAVFNFMRSKLLQNPPRNKVRATSYLGSPHFNYGHIQNLELEEKLSFLIDFLGKIKEHIMEQERMFKQTEPSVLTKTNPPKKDYLITPALGQYYNFINVLLSKHWVTQEMKKKIDEALNLQQWILTKLKKDFPLRSYSYYERIYYSGIRKTLKKIMNQHFMSLSKKGPKNVDYLIYQNILMSEKEE
ncbi:HEAT repeat domain-containing protein [Candidatus Parabeggiatoa sp. HSG14]|uniref:HEAT repeat domain-containing protein n=1 Tax=Candidatus Parabeggiatoa sp. HSG14 TaxID=3055593 RepID=UPI0025A76E6D|nr:HEAT repeat domain-containing protein [Thiotrichales bacterium HSG14]